MPKFPDRRKYLGASLVAGALGIAHKPTPLEVWRFLTGRDGEPEQNGPMARGSRFEDPVIELYEKKHGAKVTSKQATLQSDEFPHLRAHCDGILSEHVPLSGSVQYSGPGILEVKCPGYHSLDRAVKDGLPHSWVVQMQVMLALSGYSWGRYAVYDYENHDVIVFDVKVSDRAKKLAKRASDWYEKHVLGDIPPDIDEEPLPALPRITPGTYQPEGEARDTLARMLEDYLHVKSAEKVAKRSAERIREKIIPLCGGPDGLKKTAVPDVGSVSVSIPNTAPKADVNRLMRWAKSLAEAARRGDVDAVMTMARHAEDPDEFFEKKEPTPRITIRAEGEFRKLIEANQKEDLK